MKTKDAIAAFGSTKDLAAVLGITVFAIYQWGDNVPPLRAYQIHDILSARDCAETVAVDPDGTAKTESPKAAA